jgi:hypothetical protein
MKKTIATMAFVAVVIGMCGHGLAGKKPEPASTESAEQSGIVLLFLQTRGYLSVHMDEACPVVSVEPRFWAVATHDDKRNLCAHALRFIGGLDANKAHKFVCITFRDMTTRQELARVEVKTGRIDIYK